MGNACVPATVPDAPADDGDPNTDDIAVIERGVCFFFEKVQAVEAHGWDGWLVFNDAGRPEGDPLLTNGVIAPATLPGSFITRADALEHIFHSAATPAIGTEGEDVSVTTEFDGWGYMHLFRNTSGNLEPIDDFAIDEALDERFATGFGDLSVHEWATDPNVNVGYVAYYAGGMRVFTFGDDGLEQTGNFIDEGGNNFWGVEVFTTPATGSACSRARTVTSGCICCGTRGRGPSSRPPLPAVWRWWRSVAGCVEGDGLREPDQGHQGA